MSEIFAVATIVDIFDTAVDVKEEFEIIPAAYCKLLEKYPQAFVLDSSYRFVEKTSTGQLRYSVQLHFEFQISSDVATNEREAKDSLGAKVRGASPMPSVMQVSLYKSR